MLFPYFWKAAHNAMPTKKKAIDLMAAGLPNQRKAIPPQSGRDLTGGQTPQLAPR